MRKPKIVLFDYGETLLVETPFDGEKASAEVMKYAVRNRDNLTPKQVARFSDDIFQKLGKARDAGFELHHCMMLRFQYEYLGLEFSLPVEELEQIICETATQARVTPGVENLLACLEEEGIRTAVISNYGYSGRALQSRLDKLLPGNRFEFVIASSEYMFRKPSPYLFQLALGKAGAGPEEAWYCGDSWEYDIQGAKAAGILPVWYRQGQGPAPESGGCVQIAGWDELIDTIRKL